MDVWSEIMFWFIFFTTMYWFIAYKMATNVAVLLPSYDEWSKSYTIFYIIFGIVLIFRLVVIVMKIVS